MKFILFYSIKEIKGYFLRCLCVFLYISIYIFAILTLHSFIFGVGRESKSNQLVLFSFILIIALFTSICFMFSEKQQITQREYSILADLGISTKLLLILNIIEVTLLYFIAFAVSFPLSRIYIKFINNVYGRAIVESINNPYIEPYNTQSNKWDIVVFSIVLYFTVVLAVIVGIYINNRIQIIGNNKVYEEITDNKNFYKFCSKRNFRHFVYYGITLIITQFVPSLIFCAIIYMAPVRFEWDVVINCEKISHSIPYSAISEILESDMVSEYYLYGVPNNMRHYINKDDVIKDEKYYSYVQIKLNDENWVESAKIIENKLSDYSVSVTRYGEEEANIRNKMGRVYFMNMAVILYLSALITLLLIVGDIVKSKQNDIYIFYSLGMLSNGIIKYLVKTVQYVLRVSGITSSILTVLVFSLMNVTAGEKIKSWLIYIMVGIVLFNLFQMELLPKIAIRIAIRKVRIYND